MPSICIWSKIHEVSIQVLKAFQETDTCKRAPRIPRYRHYQEQTKIALCTTAVTFRKDSLPSLAGCRIPRPTELLVGAGKCSPLGHKRGYLEVGISKDEYKNVDRRRRAQTGGWYEPEEAAYRNSRRRSSKDGCAASTALCSRSPVHPSGHLLPSPRKVSASTHASSRFILMALESGKGS